MKVRFAVLAALVFGIGQVFAQPGVITVQSGGAPLDEVARSTGDWYTMEKYKPSVLTGVTTVSTQWTREQCKGFYNNRQDSSRTVVGITQAGDTVKYSIPSEGTLWKLPIIDKLIATGSQDSVYLMMQKR